MAGHMALALLLELCLCSYYGHAAALPTATVTLVSPQGPYYPGDRVSLRCDIAEHTDWNRYYWRGPEHIEAQSQTIITYLPDQRGQYQYTCEGERSSRPQKSQHSAPTPVTVTALPTATVSVVSPQGPYYPGDQVTLRCDIAEHTDWYYYYWYRDSSYISTGLYQSSSISLPEQPGQYQFTCEGRRRDRPDKSQRSIPTSITVTEKAKAAVSLSSQPWLNEGDSVKLSCKVEESSVGWRFKWFKITSYNPEESSQSYTVLPDSSRGSGGSYTLSPAALRHTGVYVCRAERGEPPYYTDYSQPQPLWVTGVSPNDSVGSHSNWTQIFTHEPLSLSCGAQGNSTGWSLMWFTGGGGGSAGCPPAWRSETGSTCSTSSASSSDSGVYWCQSESGEQSSPINITLHHGDVILESPVHPVTEGDPLTLHCRYRNQPFDISADFYKDGTLLHTSSTGEMTIPAVSKSHEGLYKCNNTEKGESPESWVIVRGVPRVTEVDHKHSEEENQEEQSSSSSISLSVGGVSGVLILAFVLFMVHRSKYGTGGCLREPATDHQPQQQSINQNSTQGQRTNQNSAQLQISNRDPGSDSVYMPLQNSATAVYETIKPSRDQDEVLPDSYPGTGGDYSFVNGNVLAWLEVGNAALPDISVQGFNLLKAVKLRGASSSCIQLVIIRVRHMDIGGDSSEFTGQTWLTQPTESYTILPFDSSL
ncbi:cell adhesion molecule-related/down-regulated by oncogenes-like [Engraulis encrasicolus]|uniref:cell adhesion molecule-related/down-regulated by oncogenes-like n=1 Tax=Engraulis encrasicolus TaxID=184585 RepID=UPI002FD31E75